MKVFQVLEMVCRRPTRLRSFGEEEAQLDFALECLAEKRYCHAWSSLTEEELEHEKARAREDLQKLGRHLTGDYELWLLTEEVECAHPLMLLKANALLKTSAALFGEFLALSGDSPESLKSGHYRELLDYLGAQKAHALAAFVQFDRGGDELALLVSDGPLQFENALEYFEIERHWDSDTDTLTTGFGFEIVDLDDWDPAEEAEENAEGEPQ